jgi:assimilatory nitrate reductase catalytic subunit
MVWIACTNPAQSMPDLRRVHQALARAELVVVQDAYQTPATVAFADVLLPASTWGEKDGTVTNSERRISRVRPAVAPFGLARHDWAIAADFGRRLSARLPGASHQMFEYDCAEQVWNEHRESTRGRDLDITGLSYRLLERQGPQQWPFRSGDTAGAVRLYADGRFETPGGRARFSSAAPAPVAEPTDPQYPLQLTTGRLRDQWHGMSRTGQLASLFSHRPEPALYLHAKDRDDHGLADGDLVRVRSRRGAMTLPVATSDDMRAGTVFIAMHWGPEWVVGRAGEDRMLGVNGLTSAAVDPVSRQPELKHCAVRLETPALPAQLQVFGWVEAGAVTTTRQALLALFDDADFCSCVPFGRDREGLALRVAHRSALDPQRLAHIAQVFGVAQRPLLRYDDPRTGNARHLALDGPVLSFVMLAGDLRPAPWLREYLETGMPVASIGRLLLSPSATAPTPMRERGRVVCNCYDVREPAIRDALAGAPGNVAQRVEAVQRELSCGTRCGSCVPELRRLAASLVDALH